MCSSNVATANRVAEAASGNIVGSSIVMTVPHGPTVFGMPLFTVLGLLGYVIAFCDSVWIIVSIWRADGIERMGGKPLSRNRSSCYTIPANTAARGSGSSATRRGNMTKHCNHGYALLIAGEPECWCRATAQAPADRARLLSRRRHGLHGHHAWCLGSVRSHNSASAMLIADKETP